ncbi:hypothetical protein [Paenibacillus sp. SI8]|uniref:hypothetical protein n=1 Tax=unclassified Paenibacillus TaxID=185978 RepID=UPI003467B978
MNKTLTTNTDLFAASLTQTTVIVSTGGNLEYAGIIRGYCDNYVRIHDTWFSRKEYEFSIMARDW